MSKTIKKILFDTIKKLKEEILEYEEIIDNLTPQLCGDENDEEFEEEIIKYEEIISRNKRVLDDIYNVIRR